MRGDDIQEQDDTGIGAAHLVGGAVRGSRRRSGEPRPGVLPRGRPRRPLSRRARVLSTVGSVVWFAGIVTVIVVAATQNAALPRVPSTAEVAVLDQPDARVAVDVHSVHELPARLVRAWHLAVLPGRTEYVLHGTVRRTAGSVDGNGLMLGQRWSMVLDTRSGIHWPGLEDLPTGDAAFERDCPYDPVSGEDAGTLLRTGSAAFCEVFSVPSDLRPREVVWSGAERGPGQEHDVVWRTGAYPATGG